MLAYIARRLLYMLLLLVISSVIAFAVIYIQPGDFLTRFSLSAPPQRLDELRARYGLDQPAHVQYWKWVTGIVTRLDFGYSLETKQPVGRLLFISGDRLLWTVILALSASIVSVGLGMFLGIYSATRRGTIGDHAASSLSVLGLTLPNFLLALLLLWALVSVGVGRWNLGIGGLVDVRFVDSPWTLAKFVNLLWHLWPAVLVAAMANVAMISRHLRAQLLDVLESPYVYVARAKGLPERSVLYKHALRNAINPLITMLGLWLPTLFESTLVAAVVLQLPIVEGAFWQALLQGDQYVIMSALLFFSALLLTGNLIADLLLAWSNPRLRYGD